MISEDFSSITAEDICFYSRKSKFTGKGESIGNQIEMGKDYSTRNFGVTLLDEHSYEDEGYSGGTTDRPKFKLLMEKIKQKKYKVLIVYRLDRISRNIIDFADIIETLNKYNVAFISIRESFDTTTPMGRAMMYIASVFAQLERETAAERIRDNMIELAKTGRWLGGITPQGFDSEPITIIDLHGKERHQFKLVPNTQELEMINLVFDKFLELNSLTQLESFCVQNNKRTRNNIDFSRFALRSILTNPVYATADKEAYTYLVNNGFDIYADEKDFDGKHGLMVYNKTSQEKGHTNKIRDNSEWIVAIGAHPGVIPGKQWVKVQHQILQNSSKSYRKVKNSESLLSGLLRCAKCGSYMRPRISRTNKEGVTVYYYMCELKEKSKKTRCDIKNVHGNDLDKLVIEEIKKLSSSDSELSNKIGKEKLNIEITKNSISSEIEMLEKNIKENEHAISNLVNTLSQAQNTGATKYIIAQINEKDKQTVSFKTRLAELRERSENHDLKNEGFDVMKDMLATFSQIIDTLDVAEKRNMIRSLTEKITWDGEFIDLVMFGANNKKKETES
ncbi:recombinase family protein [Desulfosporosinus sp.]|uniref:recombinase family protein n=1 Tax=Desulfosporosinus sp. TaxID=157907 RepID=UPI0026025490|nr:recombinase family protein [Desulfosporosinus sp.]